MPRSSQSPATPSPTRRSFLAGASAACLFGWTPSLFAAHEDLARARLRPPAPGALLVLLPIETFSSRAFEKSSPWPALLALRKKAARFGRLLIPEEHEAQLRGITKSEVEAWPAGLAKEEPESEGLARHQIVSIVATKHGPGAAQADVISSGWLDSARERGRARGTSAGETAQTAELADRLAGRGGDSGSSAARMALSAAYAGLDGDALPTPTLASLSIADALLRAPSAGRPRFLWVDLRDAVEGTPEQPVRTNTRGLSRALTQLFEAAEASRRLVSVLALPTPRPLTGSPAPKPTSEEAKARKKALAALRPPLWFAGEGVAKDRTIARRVTLDAVVPTLMAGLGFEGGRRGGRVLHRAFEE